MCSGTKKYQALNMKNDCNVVESGAFGMAIADASAFTLRG